MGPQAHCLTARDLLPLQTSMHRGCFRVCCAYSIRGPGPSKHPQNYATLATQMPLNLGHPKYPSSRQMQLPSLYIRHHAKCGKPHTYPLFCSIERSLTLPASPKAAYVSTPPSTGPGGKVSCGRESTSTSVFNLWHNHASSSTGMRPCIGHSTMVRQKSGSPSYQLEGPRQSVGVHHPNSRAHTKMWESMVKMSKTKCEKGWKWAKVGENPKVPYAPCGRSIKTYARGNNDAPSITMGMGL